MHYYIRPSYLFTIAAVLLFSVQVYSQEARISGVLMDSVQKTKIKSAVVSLFSSDSSLLHTTRTDANGLFQFSSLPKGHHFIEFRHPEYEPRTIRVSVESNETIILINSIYLLAKVKLLDSVLVVSRQMPVRFNRDTLEFNTGHLILKPNANVEDLLRRLPGLEIDADGNMKINGEKIERLLVDWEDIFSGDPTIVTRNFNADMVAKVQFIDKKSGKAALTGIDDGARTKTVNLSLKPDSRRSLFGKAEAGGDFQKYYNCNGLIGSLFDSRQIVGLGISSNAGINGFSSSIADAGADIQLNATVPDALGTSAGKGIPRTNGAAFHYADKWNGNHILSNYQYTNTITHPVTTSLIEQFLPNSLYLQNSMTQSTNQIGSQSGIGSIDWQIDSINALRFSIGGATTNGTNQFFSSGNSFMSDTLVNTNNRNITSSVNDRNLAASAIWRLLLPRRRNLTFSITANKEETSTNGFLHSFNQYFSRNNLIAADTIDQRKEIQTSNESISGHLSFLQPIIPHVSIGLEWGMSFNSQETSQGSFSKSGNKYLDTIDSLTNNFKNNTVLNNVVITIQGMNRRLQYSLGGEWNNYSLYQTNITTGGKDHFNYTLFSPRINSRVMLNSNEQIALDYSGQPQAPAVSQLQPVPNNNDPLHLYIGNPGLAPSFTHRIRIMYSNLKWMHFTSWAAYGLIKDLITTRTVTDNFGRQITQLVNVNGANSGNIYAGISGLVPALKANFNFNLNTSYTQNINYVNGDLCRNDDINLAAGLTVTRSFSNYSNVQLNLNLAYNTQSSSVTSQAPHYWSQNNSIIITYFPLTGLEITNTVFYTWRQATDNFKTGNSSLLLNASVAKLLMKNLLTIKFQVNNALDQNIGISRYFSQNNYGQSTTNTLSRFWQLSAAFRFNRKLSPSSH